VLLDADGLGEAAMQAIARAVGFNETGRALFEWAIARATRAAALTDLRSRVAWCGSVSRSALHPLR
jgi:hypothetical protein